MDQSSTRREELLLGPDVIQRVFTLRRMWGHLAETEGGPVAATEQLLSEFRKYDTNEEFLNTVPGGANNNGRGF